MSEKENQLDDLTPTGKLWKEFSPEDKFILISDFMKMCSKDFKMTEDDVLEFDLLLRSISSSRGYEIVVNKDIKVKSKFQLIQKLFLQVDGQYKKIIKILHFLGTMLEDDIISRENYFSVFNLICYYEQRYRNDNLD